MNFLKAINSGKKIKSEYWEADRNMNSTLFTEEVPDFAVVIFEKTAKPLTWKEIFGDWSVVE
jgi:hypothetical protein